MPMLQVESLSFSFKALNKISNLKCLDNLVKLQLDNNQIAKIEKLDHLVRPCRLRVRAAPCCPAAAAIPAAPTSGTGTLSTGRCSRPSALQLCAGRPDA